ncbi:MAG: hypothetical protein JO270_24965, partial [Acidobacteriaceae bacterium]|nr:hypothetical protein [Acidobacteriaceae bacterium]
MTSPSVSHGSALRDVADNTPQTIGESLPTWDLADLFPTARLQDVAVALERIRQHAECFADTHKGRVASLTPEQLTRAVEAYERLEEAVARLSAFAELTFSAQSDEPNAGQLLQFVTEEGVSITNKLLFFTLEINRVDESSLAGWQKNAAVRKWQPWLRDLRVFREHQLEDDLEELFSEKDVVDRGWARLFDQTLAALRVSLPRQELTLSSALSRLSDARRQVRQETAAALSQALVTIRPTASLILNTLAKSRSIADKWRRYDKPVSHRNLSNMVEDAVVDALVAAVTTAYPRLSHRYYDLKARWLGLQRLQHWDRNAPLADERERYVPWKDAVSHVTASYERFSPGLGATVRAFLAQPWIDAALRPGKASGAFSHPTVPSVHPYILMNYHGRPRDVMTLAHEVGHAIHQTLSAKQGYLLSSTPLILAETASVFGEMLTFRAWLDKEQDPRRRRHLLAAKIEDALNTVVRQIAFYQ